MRERWKSPAARHRCRVQCRASCRSLRRRDFRNQINAHEIGRIRIPSVRERLTLGLSICNRPEPLQRASQMFVERVLKEEFDAMMPICVSAGK